MLQVIIPLAIAQSATGIATKPKRQMGGVTGGIPLADWSGLDPKFAAVDTWIPTTLVEVWSQVRTWYSSVYFAQQCRLSGFRLCCVS